MCKECWQIPCHPRCPNAPDPKIRGHCGRCGDDLVEGYDYYTDLDNNKFCSLDCAIEYYGIYATEWEEDKYDE